jgi:hypothetical protein
VPDHNHVPGEFQPGQTDVGDVLRLHLLTVHGISFALTLTDDVASGLHRIEHREGAGPHPDHDRSWNWSVSARKTLTSSGYPDHELLWEDHLRRVDTAKLGMHPAPDVRVTGYSVTIMSSDFPDRQHWTVKVDHVRGGLWTVSHLGEIADREGVFAVTVEEGLMELGDALAVAKRIAPTIEVQGVTATERYRQWKAADGG